MMPFCYLLAYLILSFVSVPISADGILAAAKRLIPTIQSWGGNPVFVAMVHAQNDQGLTLEQIKARDKKWQETSGIDPFMVSLMNNNAAKELLRLERSAPYYLEFFLMDAQGAIVALTNKTSDYWQGDEEKFTRSYNDGVGAVHIGPIHLDNSSQAYLIQIAVPVMDEGKAIGALAVGINLDKLGR
jgi:hypothetical protein